MSNLDHRKATRTIKVTDKNGMPVRNAGLRLLQKNHEFLFGCGGFDFLALYFIKDEQQKAFYKDITDKWLKVYNYATLPFYLGEFEPTEGNPMTESRMAAAKYLTERGVKVKGHPLVWHTVCADWLMAYDNKTILEKLLKRIDREVTDFKGIIDKWDVINEVVIMPEFDKYDNAVTRVCKEYGRIPLVKAVFDEAHSMNPSAELLLNDFNTSKKYEDLIEACLDAGVPITTIGIQSHQHQGYWGTDKLYDVLERFSRFGLPIHFTENTLLSGDYLVPEELDDLNDFQVTAEEWPSTPKGEEIQMKQMEEMYRILFEHPLVKAVTGWDFTDGMWLNAPSGVIRRDGTVKPSYELLDHLINHEWHTDEMVMTDGEGNVTVTGFKGGYELIPNDPSITLSSDSKTFDL